MESPTLEHDLRVRTRTDPDAEDFWNRYSLMKSYLSKEYYPWIQANCPFYTDHGDLHIRSVIDTASRLLEPHLTGRGKSELSSLDLFLILSAILWHDVGNVVVRSGHAQQVVEMTKKVKVLGFPNPDIHRLVNEISMAHAGENGLNIPREREDCSTANTTYIVYPIALAALVRFADEVSENQSRISHALLPTVPAENRIYWEYASCISASLPDLPRRRVRISVNVQQDSAAAAFPCEDYPERLAKNKLTLIEYVICRLEKMNNERAYCAPHFNRYATIDALDVSLTLIKDNVRVGSYEESIVLGDGGLKQETYPMIEIFGAFFAEHPKWKPIEIQKATRP